MDDNGPEQLREGDGFTRRILDNLFAFVGVMDLDGTLLEANRAPLEAAGISAADVLGRKFWDCYWWNWSAEAQSRLVAAHERALQGEVVRYDAQIRTAGDGRMWIDFQLAPLRDDAGRITHLVPSAMDLTERRRAEEALRESERRQREKAEELQQLMDVVPAALFVSRDPQSEEMIGNSLANRLYGAGEGENLSAGPAELEDGTRGVRRFLDREGREAPAAALPMQRAVRENAEITGEEWVVLLPDGDRITLLGSAAPLRNADGTVRGCVGAFLDISERTRADEHRNLLLAELDHRVKNVLALIQSIARQSLAAADGDAAESFTGRISALAQSHALLAGSRWEGADLADLVEKSVEPYRREGIERLEITGPGVRVKPKAAQALSLALHELATNAAKYGALSNEAGRVRIRWRLDDEGAGRLLFDWLEEGGPPVPGPPARKGFGSTLVEKTLSYELEGRVSLDYAPGGLRAALDLPLSLLTAQGGRAPARRESGHRLATGGPARLEGRRILLVEDHFLVAREMAGMIDAAGGCLAGPVRTLDDAMRLALSAPLDAAVLDIDLDGDLVWPVATELRSRGVPVLFVSGFPDGFVAPPHLADVVRLEKPVRPGRLIAALAALFAKVPRCPGDAGPPG